MKRAQRSLASIRRSKGVSGTRHTVRGNGCLAPLEKMAGCGLKRITIQGNIANSESIRIRLRGKNLIDAQKLAESIMMYDDQAAIIEVEGRRCIKFKNNAVHGKSFASCCSRFREGVRYIFLFECRPYIPSEEDKGSLYIQYKPASEGHSTQISATTKDFTRVYCTSKSGGSVTDIALSFGTAYNWLIDLDTVCLYEFNGDFYPEYESPTIWEQTLIAGSLLQGEEKSEITVERGEITLKTDTHTSKIKNTLLDLDALKGKRDEDFILEVIGNADPLLLEVEYYSCLFDDRVVLNVHYVEGDEEIKQACQYMVRRGSAYTVFAPAIYGYKTKTKEINGVINRQTDITLYYEKI